MSLEIRERLSLRISQAISMGVEICMTVISRICRKIFSPLLLPARIRPVSSKENPRPKSATRKKTDFLSALDIIFFRTKRYLKDSSTKAAKSTKEGT